MSEPDVFAKEDLERLLERAERDPAASRELDFLADVVAAAELERSQLARPGAPARTRPALHAPPWMLAAAAALLLVSLTLAWFLVRGGTPEKARLLATNEPPLYVASDLRAPDEPLDEAFPRAMEPYARRDWPAAARELERFLGEHPAHGPAHFYLAAAAEQLGEFARAEEHYSSAAAAPDALLAEHARLRLALRLHARGELERARAELEALANGGGELAANARALLAAEAR